MFTETRLPPDRVNAFFYTRIYHTPDSCLPGGMGCVINLT